MFIKRLQISLNSDIHINRDNFKQFFFQIELIHKRDELKVVYETIKNIL